MEINQIALFEILRDLTNNIEILAKNVQRLNQHIHTHPNPTEEAQPPFQPFPVEGVNLGSIRVLHQRLDAICQELRSQS